MDKYRIHNRNCAVLLKKLRTDWEVAFESPELGILNDRFDRARTVRTERRGKTLAYVLGDHSEN